MEPGIHLFHKPAGPSSFSLVQACVDATKAASAKKTPKFCHGGALDPFASGLLLVLVGGATKLFDHLHAVPKIYEASVRWGVETDNGDPLGNVVSQGDASALREAKLQEALAGFVGWREQIPPATSNKRVDGERAYEKAHRGETVELPPERVYMHEAEWLNHELAGKQKRSRMRISVRGGYYVRSLARDLGRLLGCGAHLETLERKAIGPWKDPVSQTASTLRVSGRDLLPWLPSRILGDQEVGDLRAGRSILRGNVEEPDWKLPAGFPAEPLVRGIHREKLAYLFSDVDGKWVVKREIVGGI